MSVYSQQHQQFGGIQHQPFGSQAQPQYQSQPRIVSSRIVDSHPATYDSHYDNHTEGQTRSSPYAQHRENPHVYSQIGDMAPTNHISSNLTKEQLVYQEKRQIDTYNPNVSYVQNVNHKIYPDQETGYNCTLI